MIKPPSWKKDAVPTPKGWRHPKTGELLLPKKLSEADIAEYMGTPAPVTLTEAPTTAEEHAEEHVEPIEVDEDDLEDMTKLELEELGREHGVELDRRQKKSTLIGKVKNLMS
jgi:hypothetical protein|tara:strand:+ start:203 stop:538 length:336 start_codon:yes stop_codon:yes gene_type:complete